MGGGRRLEPMPVIIFQCHFISSVFTKGIFFIFVFVLSLSFSLLVLCFLLCLGEPGGGWRWDGGGIVCIFLDGRVPPPLPLPFPLPPPPSPLCLCLFAYFGIVKNFITSLAFITLRASLLSMSKFVESILQHARVVLRASCFILTSSLSCAKIMF